MSRSLNANFITPLYARESGAASSSSLPWQCWLVVEVGTNGSWARPAVGHRARMSPRLSSGPRWSPWGETATRNRATSRARNRLSWTSRWKSDSRCPALSWSALPKWTCLAWGGRWGWVLRHFFDPREWRRSSRASRSEWARACWSGTGGRIQRSRPWVLSGVLIVGRGAWGEDCRPETVDSSSPSLRSWRIAIEARVERWSKAYPWSWRLRFEISLMAGPRRGERWRGLGATPMKKEEPKWNRGWLIVARLICQVCRRRFVDWLAGVRFFVSGQWNEARLYVAEESTDYLRFRISSCDLRLLCRVARAMAMRSVLAEWWRVARVVVVCQVSRTRGCRCASAIFFWKCWIPPRLGSLRRDRCWSRLSGDAICGGAPRQRPRLTWRGQDQGKLERVLEEDKSREQCDRKNSPVRFHNTSI